MSRTPFRREPCRAIMAELAIALRNGDTVARSHRELFADGAGGGFGGLARGFGVPGAEVVAGEGERAERAPEGGLPAPAADGGGGGGEDPPLEPDPGGARPGLPGEGGGGRRRSG